MFERYTEKARRIIFFARYEASQFGSAFIETEHLLLGIIREDKALTNRFLRSQVASIRKEVENQTTVREKTSTSVDLPLSNESKRVLAYAGEEAERLAHKHIGTEHLLLGLLREEKCFSAQILVEPGVGKRTIVARLARRIADGAIPQSLAEKTILALDLPPLRVLDKDSSWHDRLDRTLVAAAEEGKIFFVSLMHDWPGGISPVSSIHVTELLQRPIGAGKIQCISAAAPATYTKLQADRHWLAQYFEPIQVAPSSEEAAIEVLHSVKGAYERFHKVSYADDAITHAVFYASSCIKT